MKNKDLFYHIADWILAILIALIPAKKGNYITVIILLVMTFFITTILVFVKKYTETRRELSVYESLLRYPIPLYGLVNYISKQKSINPDYINTDIHLDEISLNVKLTGNISASKNNDLMYYWTFIGKTTSSKEIGDFYLRIGGDSAVSFNHLNITCTECSKTPNCKYINSPHKCSSIESCSESIPLNFANINIQDSKTLYLMRIYFSEKLKEYANFILKVSYCWPQCYNCNYDFLLIDPNNFAKSVKNIRITVDIDNAVIKPKSKVQLFSINRSSSKIENEGQVMLTPNQNAFTKLYEIEPDKIYFVTIENN